MSGDTGGEMGGAGALPAQRFRFVARDAEGRRTASSLSAPDRAAAQAELRRRGLFPVSLEPEGPATGARAAVPGKPAASPPRARPEPAPPARMARAEGMAGRRGAQRARAAGAGAGARAEAKGQAGRELRLADQALLLESLARLVERRITPDRALMIVARGRSGRIAETAEEVRRHVRTCSSLPDALTAAGALADTAAAALLRAGDAAGDLAGALGTAARILNGRLAAGRRLTTGLIYPAILLAVSVASVGLVLVVIIPEFRPLVADRFDLVPPLGQMVFAVSAGLEALWPLFLGGLAVTGLAVASLMRRGHLAPTLLRIARRLPLIGPAVAENRAMLALRILGALVDRRVPLVRALEILAATPPDPDRLDRLVSATRRVERGEPLSEACEAEALLPPAAIEMMRIGEETGTLPAMLLRAADDLEEAAGRRMTRVLTLIEPALIVSVGCVIGISLYALFTAITAVNTLAF